MTKREANTARTRLETEGGFDSTEIMQFDDGGYAVTAHGNGQRRFDSSEAVESYLADRTFDREHPW